MRKKYCVVVFSVDGLQSEVTGVGVITSCFVRNFDRIFSKTNIPIDDISLFCVTPFLSSSASAYSNKIKNETENKCKKYNGSFVIFNSAVKGNQQFDLWNGESRTISTQEQWDSCNKFAYTFLKKTALEYDCVFAFLHDSCFLNTSCLTCDIKNVYTIWLPHSTSIDFLDCWYNERSFEEKRSLFQFKLGKNYIGSVSPYIETALIKRYNINKNLFKPFYNRIDSYRYEKFKNLTYENENTMVDKKLIFMWGRCVEQKGFLEVLPYLKTFLEANKNFHLVLLLPIETSNLEYLKKINNMLSLFSKETFTLFNKYDSDLPLRLLSYKNLSIVILPSLFESMGLTALEAIEFSSDDVLIVYRNIPAFYSTLSGFERAIPFNKEYELNGIMEKSNKEFKTYSESIQKNIFLNFSEQYKLAFCKILEEQINNKI